MVIKKLNERLKGFESPRNTITGKESLRIQGDIALVTYIANIGTQRGMVTSVYRRAKDNKRLILHIHENWAPKKLRGSPRIPGRCDRNFPNPPASSGGPEQARPFRLPRV